MKAAGQGESIGAIGQWGSMEVAGEGESMEAIGQGGQWR